MMNDKTHEDTRMNRTAQMNHSFQATKANHPWFSVAVDPNRDVEYQLLPETPFRALNEFNVLVKIDKVEEKTAGGLIKPASAVERDRHMAVRATIMQTSGLAFNADIWAGDDKPQAGDRVMLSKHAGIFVEDNDELKIVKDRDVLAVLVDVTVRLNDDGKTADVVERKAPPRSGEWVQVLE